ncbi:MAG TPA: hypothetical protein VMT62_08790 [Syntrophorhabdaceae bacterium]|nr:hypothetical protein [Syntrophorhabdaceae bacterium]
MEPIDAMLAKEEKERKKGWVVEPSNPGSPWGNIAVSTKRCKP